MKPLKMFIFGMLLLLTCTVKAQVTVNVNMHPPLWGPVGYSNVRYYYLPDVEAYYDVQSSMFIYYDRGVWIHRPHLAPQYSGYDLYGGYKVVMTDYHGDAPYTHFREHKMFFAKGYRGKSQKTIGVKPEKENSYANKPSKGQSNKNVSHGNAKVVGHNNKNMNKSHGNGGGGGKGKESGNLSLIHI